jgi:catechol 2,3-dioxygenase-like lactoylglutathione lyase family enzyme
MMAINSLYPVICTDKITESKEFYIKHFNFEVTFEADWYVSLRTPHSPHFELALLDYRHESIPQAFQTPTRGVLINIEVLDVDRDYNRIQASGLSMVLDIKSEQWGQRHFIIKDPNDLLVDVVQTIPPSESYEQQYV